LRAVSRDRRAGEERRVHVSHFFHPSTDLGLLGGRGRVRKKSAKSPQKVRKSVVTGPFPPTLCISATGAQRRFPNLPMPCRTLLTRSVSTSEPVKPLRANVSVDTPGELRNGATLRRNGRLRYPFGQSLFANVCGQLSSSKDFSSGRR
jgi:hypothetical protein